MTAKVRTIATAAVGGILVALAATGLALAVTSNSFTYSSEKTGWLKVPPSALVPDTGATVAWSNVSDYALRGTTSNIVCLNAPVNVPQGVKLTALAVWYARVDTTGFIAYTLMRRHVPEQTGDTIVGENAPASGNARVVLNTDITDPTLQTVNNRLYIYWLHVCLQSGGTFFGARLTYKYTNAGD